MDCQGCKYVYRQSDEEPCRDCRRNITMDCNEVHPDLWEGEDVVNHPKHYAESCSLECIQVMKLLFGEEWVAHFCLCNAFKYMWRFKNKNGQEDLKKCEWYLKTAKDLNIWDTEGFIESMEDLRKELENDRN